jgi:hypothetical protein
LFIPEPNTGVAGTVEDITIFNSKSSIELGLEVVTVGRPGELVALSCDGVSAGSSVWGIEVLSIIC